MKGMSETGGDSNLLNTYNMEDWERLRVVRYMSECL